MAFLTEAYTDNLQRNSKTCTARGCAALIKTRHQGSRIQEEKDNRDSIRFVNFDKYCRLEKVA